MGRIQRLFARQLACPYVRSSASATTASVMSFQDMQRCIRQSMVRHVLLASQPLTVDELADLVNKTLSLQLCSAKMVGVHGTLKRLSNALMSEECCGSVPNPDRDVSKNVESVVRLLLAVDPQFRVSPGGYVCYPNLPSLFLASSSVCTNGNWMSSARTVVRTAESEAKRRGRKKGGGGRLRCGDGSACATARGDKGQGWSYILSLWCLLDSLAECEVGGRIQPGGRACNVNSGCGHDTSRGEVTVSEKLVDSWMGAFDAGDVPSILCGGGTGSGCGGGHQTARRAVPPLEFRECVEGSDALRRWHTEAKEGFVSELLTVKSFPSPSARNLLQQVNFHLGYLFNLVIAAPITLGRLTALIQWDELPFSAYYRSFLHFLVVYTACSAVAQMERHEMRRRVTEQKWRSLLWPRVHEKWERQQLSRRFASFGCAEGLVAAQPVGDGQKNSNASSGDNGTARSPAPTGEVYEAWVRCNSGPVVNPKCSDICRCVLFQPHKEMTPLDATTRTPSEVLEAVLQAVEKKPEIEKRACGSCQGGSVASEAANGMVVFALSPYIIEQRICRFVRLWWFLEGKDAARKPSNNAVITVKRLCQLCLWEHEYGPRAAPRMMLHYLRSVSKGVDNVLRLKPPPSSETKSTGEINEDAGKWRVVVPLITRDDKTSPIGRR